MVVRGGTRDGSAPGCAEPRDGGPNELARSRRGQLELALPGRHAARASPATPSRADSDLQPGTLTPNRNPFYTKTGLQDNDSELELPYLCYGNQERIVIQAVIINGSVTQGDC